MARHPSESPYTLNDPPNSAGRIGNKLNIGNSSEPWTGGSQSVKNISGIKNLTTGATMTLLDQSRVAADKGATNVNAGSEFTVGTATEGTGKLVFSCSKNCS